MQTSCREFNGAIMCLVVKKEDRRGEEKVRKGDGCGERLEREKGEEVKRKASI